MATESTTQDERPTGPLAEFGISLFQDAADAAKPYVAQQVADAKRRLGVAPGRIGQMWLDLACDSGVMGTLELLNKNGLLRTPEHVLSAAGMVSDTERARALAIHLEQENAVLWAELVRHEHESLRWENPVPIPEWTQRIRAQLDRPWEPDCSSCATGPGRYYRDRHIWPRLYGWSSEGVEVPA